MTLPEPDLSSPGDERRNRRKTTTQGLRARAGRAAEDPGQMTSTATLSRLARHVVVVLRKNPDLTDRQAAKAAALLLRAEMSALGQRSGEARRPQKAC